MWNNQGGYDQQGGYGEMGGGGYMNSPGMGSPGQSQERKQRQRAQNVLPVTVSMVLNATQQDDKFVIDNIDLHQVTIVGMVRSVREQPTRIDYDIDDMSGPPIEVRHFVDNDESTPDEDRTVPMRENTYVRLYAHVRAFGGKRSLVAFKMVPLTDANELTTHLLEIMHSHIFLTKSQGGGGGAAPAGGTGYVPQGDVNPSFMGGGMQPDQGLTPVQQQVYNVIKSCPDETGIGLDVIGGRLQGLPQKAIRDAIEFLSGEGHIYSTIDDEHFKSTDSC